MIYIPKTNSLLGQKMGVGEKPIKGVHEIQWAIAGYSRGFVTIWKTPIIGTSIFITKNNEESAKISMSRRKSFFFFFF